MNSQELENMLNSDEGSIIGQSENIDEKVGQPEQNETDDDDFASEDRQDTESDTPKRDKKTLIKDLLELLRFKGKLTTQEILDSREEAEFEPEQMDKIYDVLESYNIEVVDDF